MGLPKIAQDDIEPRYVEAARLRVVEGKSWEEVADELGVERRTVFNWRQTPAWQAAVLALLTIHAGQFTEIAIKRLTASAEGEPGAPGITAANSILDRVIGTVAQRVALGQDPNAGPTEVSVVTPEQVAQARKRARHRSGSPPEAASETETDGNGA